MKSLILLTTYCFAFIITTISSHSQTIEQKELFNSANEAYKEGRFGDAVISYEDILDEGYRSAELYYNLGNAYFRMDNLPYAILNYERAAKLSPTDDEIKHNLKLASAKTIDRIEPLPEIFFVSAFNTAIDSLGSGFWSVFAIASLWILLGCAYLLFLGKSKMNRKLGLYAGLLLAIVFISSLLLAWTADTRESTNNEAIVMSPTTYVRSEPTSSGQELFILHEGTKAQITDLEGEYFEIRLPDGNKGWALQSDLEKI